MCFNDISGYSVTKSPKINWHWIKIQEWRVGMCVFVWDRGERQKERLCLNVYLKYTGESKCHLFSIINMGIAKRLTQFHTINHPRWNVCTLLDSHSHEEGHEICPHTNSVSPLFSLSLSLLSLHSPPFSFGFNTPWISLAGFTEPNNHAQAVSRRWVSTCLVSPGFPNYPMSMLE